MISEASTPPINLPQHLSQHGMTHHQMTEGQTTLLHLSGGTWAAHFLHIHGFEYVKIHRFRVVDAITSLPSSYFQSCIVLTEKNPTTGIFKPNSINNSSLQGGSQTLPLEPLETCAALHECFFLSSPTMCSTVMLLFSTEALWCKGMWYVNLMF